MRAEEKPYNDISPAVITRLPRYYRYLGDLIEEGVDHISSAELSRIMNITASQIRQDLNYFGEFGKQGQGYSTRPLQKEIGKLLGLDREHTMVLIGCGNLGSALINYMNYRNRGFLFRAAFDINPALHGKCFSGVPVYPMEELTDFLNSNDIEIAVIAIPRQEAVKVVKTICDTGRIKAIWNFSHTDLDVPESVKVENVHLSESLMKLSFAISSDVVQSRIRSKQQRKQARHAAEENQDSRSSESDKEKP